jgi:hypothetical protein
MAASKEMSVFEGSVYSRCNEVLSLSHIAFLYEHSTLMYSFMTQLVTPFFSDEVERAAVTFDFTGRAFKFEVNRDFWQPLSFHSQCFVLAHEIMHPLLDHVFRGPEYVKNVRESGGKYQCVTEDVLNQMMDIEINEALVSDAYGFIRSLLSFADSICFVDTVFPEEIIVSEKMVTNQKFEYYSDIYLKHAQDSQFGGLGDLMFNYMGYLRASLDPDFNPASGDPEGVDVPFVQPEVTVDYDELMVARQAVLDEFFDGRDVTPQDVLKNKNMLNAGGAFGSGSVGNIAVKLEAVRSLDDAFDITIKKVSQQLKRTRKKTCWTAPDKRLYSVMHGIDPSMSLPSQRVEEYEVDEKQKLLVYMDTSYSCLEHVKKLMELVIGMPEDKYVVETYIFAGHVAPIDLKSNPHFYSGGTSIDRVYRHAQERFEEQDYDAVFVLTDGEFSNCHEAYKLQYKDWHWFLVPSYDTSALPFRSSVLRVK